MNKNNINNNIQNNNNNIRNNNNNINQIKTLNTKSNLCLQNNSYIIENFNKSIIDNNSFYFNNKYFNKITSFQYDKNNINNIRNNPNQKYFFERQLKDLSNSNINGNFKIYLNNNICNKNNFFTFYKNNN